MLKSILAVWVLKKALKIKIKSKSDKKKYKFFQSLFKNSICRIVIDKFSNSVADFVALLPNPKAQLRCQSREEIGKAVEEIGGFLDKFSMEYIFSDVFDSRFLLEIGSKATTSAAELSKKFSKNKSNLTKQDDKR